MLSSPPVDIPQLNTIYRGDALDVIRAFPDEFVDCIITSPPYWGLRDYSLSPVIWDAREGCGHRWGKIKIKPIDLQAGNPEFQRPWREDASNSESSQGQFCRLCGAWRGSLGLEPTPELFIKHLMLIMAELKRVLKKTGTCFVNLGDSYSSGGKNSFASGKSAGIQMANISWATTPRLNDPSIPAKSLCAIPERFVLAMLEQGWIRRNTLIWWKPNCMPSSARDRFTNDFEYVYFFTKSRKYLFEPQWEWKMRPNSLGRNKRCVWKIPTAPFKESHFAVFPPALIEPMLKAGCPEFICVKCGKARIKNYELTDEYKARLGKGWHDHSHDAEQGMQQDHKVPDANVIRFKSVSLSDCGCGAPFRPGIALDPFMGAGTVALVAYRNRRDWLGIELSLPYIKLAIKRLEKEIAR